MRPESPYIPLDDLTETPITYGIVKPGPEDPSGVTFIRSGDVNDGRINHDALRTVSRAVSEQYRRTLLEGGELLVSLVGNPGQVAVVPGWLKGANIARQVALIRLTPDVDARFVQYYLLSRDGQAALRGQALGSVQQVINLRDLKRVQVPVPTLHEQQAIADILGSLDDKIELNRRMNRTLEQMARALFQSWFVDFDPVRAKAEGRRPPGLDRATADLFPDRFEDSAVGPIPRGWHVGTIGDLVQHQKESINPDDFSGEEFDHYSVPAYDADQKPIREPGHHIRSSKYRISAETVLLAKLNPHFPRVWLPRTAGDRPAICSTEFLDLRPKHPFTRPYVYALFRSGAFREQYRLLVTGTSNSHQRVRPTALLGMPALLPPPAVLQAFTERVSSLLERCAANQRESTLLGAVRDTVLPRLVAGEISPLQRSED